MFEHIIPIPKKATKNEDQIFVATKVYTTVPEWDIYVDTAVDGFSRTYFYDFEKGEGDIVLSKDESL